MINMTCECSHLKGRMNTILAGRGVGVGLVWGGTLAKKKKKKKKKMFLPPFWKLFPFRVDPFPEGEQIIGSKFFSFSVDPFSEKEQILSFYSFQKDSKLFPFRKDPFSKKDQIFVRKFILLCADPLLLVQCIYKNLSQIQPQEWWSIWREYSRFKWNREMDMLSSGGWGATLFKLILPPFSTRVYSKRKEFAPQGSKHFPFRVDPFSQRKHILGSKFFSIRVYPFSEKGQMTRF